MLRNFRTYQLAVTFYREVKNVQLPCHLKDQLMRAAASAALNLAEGYGKITCKEKRRFFSIAMGSIRECQAVTDLSDSSFTPKQLAMLDALAASTYKLIRVSSSR